MRGVFPGGKGGRCVRLTSLPLSYAVVMKSGDLNFLETSGPLQACNGTAWSWECQIRKYNFTTFCINHNLFKLWSSGSWHNVSLWVVACNREEEGSRFLWRQPSHKLTSRLTTKWHCTTGRTLPTPLPHQEPSTDDWHSYRQLGAGEFVTFNSR